MNIEILGNNKEKLKAHGVHLELTQITRSVHAFLLIYINLI